MSGDSLGLLASPRSFRAFGRLIARWWREPVDYGAQVQYYTKRSLADAIRAMIVVGLGLFALIAIGLAFLSRDADMPTAAIMVVFAALTAYWSIAWWRNPWPSRRRSATFVVSVDSTIVLLLVMSTGWETGIYGLSSFALLAIYLMFFDGAKALAAHTVWMVVCTVDLVVDQLVVAHADTQLTAILVLLATLPVLVSPLGIQLSIWALRGDADASVHDPLTGLLNRRGLQLHFANLMSEEPSVGTYVTVMLIDLDRFKDLNDSYGHATGDRVLIHCARAIKSVVRGGAVVARVGGEEFVVVDMVDAVEGDRTSAQILEAIAQPGDHPPVSASVGVTSIPRMCCSTSAGDSAVFLGNLIARADQAMFDAKRNGGNAIQRL